MRPRHRDHGGKSSDAAIQNTVFGGGVDRMSANGFSRAGGGECPRVSFGRVTENGCEEQGP